jgi:antitoxin (DNA-binding transcriptional repressor) of toxin-antitoxin stability system
LLKAIPRRVLWEHAFVHRDSGNHKGAVAEAKIAAAAIELGIPVLKPMSEHGRYDLVFEIDDQLLKIQCKWATRKGEVVAIHLGGSYLSPRGYVRSTYGSDEIDAVAAYCRDLERCYLLPIHLVAGQYGIQLRLAPPKNSQRAALHWAADYQLHGAVAQLGERRRGTAEATGSSPVSSTPREECEQVGAHQFRNLFGWYAERAAAGEEFLITHRGKPYVRLGPPASSPPGSTQWAYSRRAATPSA